MEINDLRLTGLGLAMPRNFSLSTPHSGYHWDGRSRRFFEGWYFRLTLPAQAKSFGFMYSIDDPAGNSPQTGGAVQILGPDNRYSYRSFPQPELFWASRTQFALGHWQSKLPNLSPQLLDCDRFAQEISEGYQATALLNQGQIYDPLISDYHRWCYEVQPIYGWGSPFQPQRATAGLLSFLPIFDPGWQVLMAQGLATGWIEWYGQRYDFEQVPAYSEKNWGRSFPAQWFWINAIHFENHPSLTVTAAGALRKVLTATEAVGMIGIHDQGRFYVCDRNNAAITWQVKPWGHWRIRGVSEQWTIELEGQTEDLGKYVRVPTEQGLQFHCRDSFDGNLRLKLSDRRGNILIEAETNLAGLEVGGKPWQQEWIKDILSSG